MSVPLDHHQGVRSYPKVTTDHLSVRYTVVLRQQNHSVTCNHHQGACNHHQGARRSYPKVTTDRLLVRYTVVLRQQNHSVTY